MRKILIIFMLVLTLPAASRVRGAFVGCGFERFGLRLGQKPGGWARKWNCGEHFVYLRNSVGRCGIIYESGREGEQRS